ncbi:MAG TPA: pantoate--beta-alanine ligase [Flavobacteriaceae bacterium]|nr:pantoate--beta-alanine ligase [Flavobacteriaceae bacterium]
MLTFTEKEKLTEALAKLINSRSEIGFVPTMGALHQGHLSLVKQALKENDLVVVSIFVNPTQFDNPADLEKYPRTPEKDILLLKEMGDKVWVYLPAVEDLYGNNVSSEVFSFDNLENEMEGKHRAGHFDGVGTVVAKLFNAVQPTRAYFGEKDFQQLQIIKKLVEKQKLNIEIISCPILREENGLAMSSRNERLSNEDKKEALALYEALQWAKNNFEQLSIPEITKEVTERFLRNPKVQLEYFEIADEQTLKSKSIKEPSVKYRAFIAAFVGNVRLIDNMSLN